MKLYLDTEFNGHGGDLISIALAGDDGSTFYAEAPEPRVWNEWVFDNVFPHLHHKPEEMTLLRFRLREYLRSRGGASIFADWPADFEHLMRLMTGSSYDESFMVECTLHLLRGTDPQPETPHNALSDAVALRDWHNSTLET